MICARCKKEILGDLHSVVENIGDMHMPCFLQWLKDNEFTIDEDAMDFFRDFGSIYLMAFTILAITIMVAVWVSNDWQILSNP